MDEKITLILNDISVEVNKEKLASKSRYFEALFSHNFNDSYKKKHVINYEIPLSTLKNFVEWICKDEEYTLIKHHSIKASMMKFVNHNFIELLNLLQLSILFAVDELTNDAIDIIILCWLLPEKIIDTWLLAQELNVRVLQDVCISVCLDRFEELPLSLLIELTKDNIMQLIENVNVRCSVEYLKFVRNEWIKYHMISDISEIKDVRRLKFSQGIVIYNMYESSIKDACLYTWNGISLSRCVQLKNMQDSRNSIIGMQVAGRGFSIYTIGGEVGLGTGKFVNIIWRYCLISRKWYYHAYLPVSRRHMITVFLKNKLVIAGGVGKHRLKLPTVDILDVHTGNWTKGAEVPETFTEVPPYCVFNGKLFFLKSSLYIYSLQENCWQIISIINNPAVQRVTFLTYGRTLFFMGNHLDETVLTRIDVTQEAVCRKEDCLNQCVEHKVITNAKVVHKDNSYQLRLAHVGDIDIMVLNTHCDEKYRYLQMHTDIKRDFENPTIPKMGCIDIIDPATLYDTVQH